MDEKIITSLDMMPYTEEAAQRDLARLKELFGETGAHGWEEILKEGRYYIVNLMLWYDLLRESYLKNDAEIRKLREALAFYGDKKNHCLRLGRDAEHFFKGSEVAYDMGKRARVALGAAPAPEKEGDGRF